MKEGINNTANINAKGLCTDGQTRRRWQFCLIYEGTVAQLHSCMHLFSAGFTRVFRLFQTVYNFV